MISLSKGDIVGALEGHREGESVEAVRFIDLAGSGIGSGVVITGGTDGKACIWDLTTMRLRATLDHEVSGSLPRLELRVKNWQLNGCANSLLRTR